MAAAMAKKLLFCANIASAQSCLAELFQAVKDLLHHGSKEENEEHSVAHCAEFAQTFCKQNYSDPLWFGVVYEGPVGVPMPPACPMLMDEFQFL